MDWNDRDAMIRTIIGEAGNQSPVGQAAVASVILNRAKTGKYGGTSPADVVFAPKQFSTWNDPGNANKLWSISPQDPKYQQVGRIVDAVASGAPDPTGGATHYLNAATVKAEGNYDTASGLPKWADPSVKTADIGAHSFYAPNGAVGGGASPMAYASTPSSATQGAQAMDPITTLIQAMGHPSNPATTAAQNNPGLHGFLGRGLMNLFNGNGFDIGAVRPRATTPNGTPTDPTTGLPNNPTPADHVMAAPTDPLAGANPINPPPSGDAIPTPPINPDGPTGSMAPPPAAISPAMSTDASDPMMTSAGLLPGAADQSNLLASLFGGSA